jgi:hypothetical protein
VSVWPPPSASDTRQMRFPANAVVCLSDGGIVNDDGDEGGVQKEFKENTVRKPLHL